jgi:hypothetical protein
MIVIIMGQVVGDRMIIQRLSQGEINKENWHSLVQI